MARSPLQCLCEESEVVCVWYHHTGTEKRHTDLELHLALPSEMPPASDHPEKQDKLKYYTYTDSHIQPIWWSPDDIHLMHACLDTQTHKNAMQHINSFYYQPLHKTEQIISQIFSKSSCQIWIQQIWVKMTF